MWLPDAPTDSYTSRHLAEYSFRFASEDVEPLAELVEVPTDSAAWSLAHTLAEVRRRGAVLTRASRGVKLRHGHRLPALAAAVRQHEPALVTWLDLGGPDAAAPRPFDAVAWDDEVRLHAVWFSHVAVDLPVPFPLRPGVVIADASLFRASVAGRLAAGPDAPSAPGLRSDLAALFAARIETVPAAPAWPPVAKAA